MCRFFVFHKPVNRRRRLQHAKYSLYHSLPLPNIYTRSQKFQVQYLVQPATFHVVVVVVVLIVTHVSISQNFHTSFQKVSPIDTHVSISFQKVSLIDTHVLNSLNFHTYFLRTFHLLTQREPA